MAFLKTVEDLAGWKRIKFGGRAGFRRAYINPKDFGREGEKAGTAYAAPEFPKFAPPEWQQGVETYLSEAEAEAIFTEHLKNVALGQWRAFEYESALKRLEAISERYKQRKRARHKRAYHYWCGYVIGMKVAFEICSKYFRYRL